MSPTSRKRPTRVLASAGSELQLHDDIGPTYARRAELMASGAAHGDWPEVYVLATALGCAIDVYWPLEDVGVLGRYALNAAQPTLPRWCLLRELESWTPLIGSVPNTDEWSVEAAANAAVLTPDGPDALFDAIATLCILMPAPSHPLMTSAELRRMAVDGLMHQAKLPYRQRDIVLMQMLALT